MAETGRYASNLLEACEHAFAKGSLGVTADEVAEKMGCTSQTAQRYLRALKRAGWLVSDTYARPAGGGYFKRWRPSPELLKRMYELNRGMYALMDNAKEDVRRGVRV